MQADSIPQCASLKRLGQGFVIGTASTMFVGFVLGGWVTSGTARKMAQRDAKEAAIAALVPICVDKFRSDAEVEKNLGTLKRISSW